MLKKVGIIAAVAATGVLGLSSLAFANEEKGNLSNDCAFENTSGDIAQGLFGGESLIGAVTDAFTATAATTATQANTANCNNVQLKDLIDDDSNNETESTVETEVEGSFKEED